jgi:signal recognition particle receptor subunit beta
VITTAKILVLGPPEGGQSDFVSAISEVKVRSSARTPTEGEFVPMDFGRVKLETEADLQLFGFARDHLDLVAEAISPGIVGAVFLASPGDIQEPHTARESIAALHLRGIPSMVAAPPGADPRKLSEALDVPEMAVGSYDSLDRDAVKSMIVGVLELAVMAMEGSAA